MHKILRCIAGTMILLTAGLAQAQDTSANLPHADPVFTGKISRFGKDSIGAFPKRVTAPADAPNILLVMTDDVGFGAASTFGGPIPTPNLDRLAAHGLRYNQFHTTAMCSPTRAALLTGRNHQAVGNGTVIDGATGYPGYWATIPHSAATVARVLRDNGYNTAMFGKHHNVPVWESSAAGPFTQWPTSLGFEYFYGFIGGDADQWDPVLYRGTERTEIDQPAAPRHARLLEERLTDDTIRWIHNQKAADPTKPFFIYYASGIAHAPHQAPADWIARFKGRFDEGWDQVRQESIARQKLRGIIPPSTTLTPRPPDINAWDSQNRDQKRISARFMEVYAAMLAYQDFQFGRVLDELERMGELDHTLVIFIEGDNGGSGEGSLQGTTNEIGMLANGVTESTSWLSSVLRLMGGPKTYDLYPVGWAWAMNTPFQWTKQIGSHFGGTRNGMVVAWPEHIEAHGEVRSQFHHVVDIAPTLLDAVGLKTPAMVDGVEQQKIDGVSLAYTWEQASAPSRHTSQYFELNGNAAMYRDGWIASTTPRRTPWGGLRAPNLDETDLHWELYDLRNDYSQAHDLATKEPKKLAELVDLFWQEAKHNNVLPMIPNAPNVPVGYQASLVNYGSHRTNWIYWGRDITVAYDAAPPMAARSFSITAEVTIPQGGGNGVLVANGSWFGGWVFYLKDGRPVAHEAFSEQPKDQFHVEADTVIPAGKATIRFDFDFDGGGPGGGGTMRILVDGKQVANGRIERTIVLRAGLGETFDIGYDTGAPVIEDYTKDGRFTGDIDKVTVELGQPGKPGSVYAAKDN
ncbi:MAG: arylsulfatase [Pseudomonadales bacterium]|jgi:arylsulfatase|nr:arylsulfatase [Pseudomonadales bacterium]MBP6227825.1 arylsulfatase [Pseudomonadales bacterium]